MLDESLKKIRLFNNLSQAELARRLGISRSQVSEIESGTRIPSHKILNAYSEHFGIPKSSIYFLAERLDKRSNVSGISKKIIDVIKWIASDDQLNNNHANDAKNNGKSQLPI